MSNIIGIDLGTTNSVVAVFEAGEPTVIANSQGNRTTPSAVAFTDDGSRLVGQFAKRQAVQNPARTIASIKRFMGRRCNEVAAETQTVPYKIAGSGEDPVKVVIGDKQYTPQEISALVLQELRTAAETYLGEKVTGAVITVPAYFNDAQRQATKDAGEIAGLKVERILNEPTAAALAYGLDQATDQRVVVFDLGGGTFDVTILEITQEEGDEKVFAVLATKGDTHLGGDDFDEVIINWLAAEFQKEHGSDLKKDLMALQRLKEAAEKAKVDLSSMPQTEIALPFISMGPDRNPLHFNRTLSRAKFEELAEPLFKRLLDPCKGALKDAGLKAADIQEVVLVGGSTRIPRVQAIAEELFGRKPNRTVNPDEVVAMGAAVQGGLLRKDSGTGGITFLDVTPLTLGVEIEHGRMAALIERNTTIPCHRSQIFTTTVDNQTQVDVKVYQGERPMVADNRFLGKFQLGGIPAAPRRVPEIEVAFDIDVNGILNVTATEKGTGKQAKVTIEGSSGLSRAEVDRMKREAEEHATEDNARKERAELQNDTESVLASARRMLADARDRIATNLAETLDGAIAEAAKALEGDDLDALRKASKALTEAQQAAAVSLYQQPAQPVTEDPVQPEAEDGDGPVHPEQPEGKEGPTADAPTS